MKRYLLFIVVVCGLSACVATEKPADSSSSSSSGGSSSSSSSSSSSGSTDNAAIARGEALYVEQHCEACHGSDGLKLPDTKIVPGARTLSTLTTYINDKMPKTLGEPGDCVGQCAADIAAYIKSWSGSSSSSSSSSGAIALPPVLGLDADAPSNGRRLTRDEFVNSVSDALGITPALLVDIRVKLERENVNAGMRNSVSALTTSRTNIDAYEDAASAIVAQVSTLKIAVLADECGGGFTDQCINNFVSNAGELLYRRPLENRQQQTLVALMNEVKNDNGDFNEAARLALQVMLQSPYFLYRMEGKLRGDDTEEIDQYELATRLSYSLWASGPDEELLGRAGRGELTGDGIDSAVEYMMQDPRAKRGFREFISEWLKLFLLENRNISEEEHPDFKDEYKPAMLKETYDFFEGIVFGDGAPFLQEAYTRQTTNIDNTVAAMYGLDRGGDYDWSNDRKRIGFLTQSSVMSVHTVVLDTSILHRGLFIADDLLCRHVPTPPENLGPVIAEQLMMTDATAPQRERMEQHNLNYEQCGFCHELFDGLGYTFEPYDSLGGFRTLDQHGNPIENSGFNEIDSVKHDFADVTDLANILASSDEAKACFVESFISYHFGHTPGIADASFVQELTNAFDLTNQNFIELVKYIVKSDPYIKRAEAQ